MGIASGIAFFVRALLSNRAAIAADNFALRHQFGVLERSVRRPRLRQRDRINSSRVPQPRLTGWPRADAGQSPRWPIPVPIPT